MLAQFNWSSHLLMLPYMVLHFYLFLGMIDFFIESVDVSRKRKAIVVRRIPKTNIHFLGLTPFVSLPPFFFRHMNGMTFYAHILLCLHEHSAVLQPLLHLFHAEPGNGVWKRKADAAFQHCTVCLLK